MRGPEPSSLRWWVAAVIVLALLTVVILVLAAITFAVDFFGFFVFAVVSTEAVVVATRTAP